MPGTSLGNAASLVCVAHNSDKFRRCISISLLTLQHFAIAFLLPVQLVSALSLLFRHGVAAYRSTLPIAIFDRLKDIVV
jgi:hypothetical protein